MFQLKRQKEKDWPTDPGGHGVGVGLAMVVVEDHDGSDHAARHHEHDAVEICTCHLIHFNHLINLLYVIKYIMLKHAINKKNYMKQIGLS